MNSLSPEIEKFLDRYDASSRDPTADWSSLFAATFLVLDPSAVHALGPEILAKALPARRALFAQAGVTSVRRVSAAEQTLDSTHVMVKASWAAERQGRSPVSLESTFVLRRGDDGWRVVVYLNHVDIQAQLASS